MATLNPPAKIIKNIKPYPSTAQAELLNYLNKNLNDDFEIFYQPYLNGDRPDIVLLTKNSGAHIIEICDWNLSDYSVDSDMRWRSVSGNQPVTPPYEKVLKYKNNLYDLHIPKLFKLKRSSPKAFGLVSCSVYFHFESTPAVNNFINSNGLNNDAKISDQLKFILLFGNDFISNNRLNKLISRFGLKTPKPMFDDNVYKSLKRIVQAPFHSLEEGSIINYTKEQLELVRSEQQPRRKIKGIAGCGKTLVLAKRAVNSHIRTSSKVLILTFNIALVNYIRDKINEVRENFYWNYFDIINYHQFFLGAALKYNMKIEDLSSFDNPDFFRPCKDTISRYSAVFIDEVQDYKTEWLSLIHNYFLEENGEFAVFGDEKQNIYNRSMDEYKEPKTVGIPGKFNKSLNKSFRFTPAISELAKLFQKEFFSVKYYMDDIVIVQQQAIDYNSNIQYFSIPDSNSDIVDLIFKQLYLYSIHSSDVAVLSNYIFKIRQLESLITKKTGEETTRMFESQVEYENLLKECSEKDQSGAATLNKKLMEMELDKIRRVYKLNFTMKTGKIKLSTIHSFKGWEIHTLFIILMPENHQTQDQAEPFEESLKYSDELIYTAMTRCRFNLFIINLGNEKYDKFFKKHIK